MTFLFEVQFCIYINQSPTLWYLFKSIINLLENNFNDSLKSLLIDCTKDNCQSLSFTRICSTKYQSNHPKSVILKKKQIENGNNSGNKFLRTTDR